MKIRYYLRGLGLGIVFTAIFFLVAGDSKQTMSDEMIKERAKELGMIESTVLADMGTTTEEEPERVSVEEMSAEDSKTAETEETVTKSSEAAETEETAAKSSEVAETEETAAKSSEAAGTEETAAKSSEAAGTEETAAKSSEAAGTEETAAKSSEAAESKKTNAKDDKTAASGQADNENSSDGQAAGESAQGQMISIVVNKGDGSDTVSRRLQEAGLVDDAAGYDKYLMQNGYDRKIGAGEHLIPVGATWQEIAQILCS